MIAGSDSLEMGHTIVAAFTEQTSLTNKHVLRWAKYRRKQLHQFSWLWLHSTVAVQLQIIGYEAIQPCASSVSYTGVVLYYAWWA